eukprot:TRINITY_DN18079_c0_g1_i1.p1 TRINITY_DN18079_c0_g1~~TRINITY_DN18079_c0_g1_i1.p1  ORF type:complete len:420 (-),score=142.43 TRINITY_DN18079_c0_g1_i1:53-1312(-)
MAATASPAELLEQDVARLLTDANPAVRFQALTQLRSFTAGDAATSHGVVLRTRAAVDALCTMLNDVLPLRVLAAASLANLAEEQRVAEQLAADAAASLAAAADALLQPPRRHCSKPGCTRAGADDVLARCGSCHSAYCGASCQREHWPAHRAACRFAVALPPAARADEPDLAAVSAKLLNNVTRFSRAAESLLAHVAAREAIARLVAAAPPAAAGVIENVTQVVAGRRLLMDVQGTQKPALVAVVLPLVQHPNAAVRAAALGAVRNVCFDHDLRVKLLFGQEEKQQTQEKKQQKADEAVLAALMIPLRGSETLDADDQKGMPAAVCPPGKREPDLACKKLVVETLLLLGTDRSCRQTLRDFKVYPLLRELDKGETDEGLKDTIVNLVSLLVNDDAPTPKPKPAAITAGDDGDGPIIEDA